MADDDPSLGLFSPCAARSGICLGAAEDILNWYCSCASVSSTFGRPSVDACVVSGVLMVGIGGEVGWSEVD